MKVNTQLVEFLESLEPVFRYGLQIEVTYEHQGDYWFIDLNTAMKSECHIHIYEESSNTPIMVHRRYNRVDQLHQPYFTNLLELVSECHHGRSFGNHAWRSLLIANGYEFPVE